MENVENVYPLTPMQEMMLLHAVSRPRFDKLFSQFRFELRGPFDSNRFRAAWQTLTDRHPALRTMFLWDNLKRPMRVVRKSVELPSMLAPITVFRIRRQQFTRTPDEALGWGRFSSAGASVIVLPTRGHDDILREPYVRKFTVRLAQVLEAPGTKGSISETVAT